MTQTAVNFKMDAALKQRFTEVLQGIGLTPSAAFTVFAKAVIRENAIPFRLVGDDEPEDVEYPYDPEEEARFYSPENIAAIKAAVERSKRNMGIVTPPKQIEEVAQ